MYRVQEQFNEKEHKSNTIMYLISVYIAVMDESIDVTDKNVEEDRTNYTPLW